MVSIASLIFGLSEGQQHGFAAPLAVLALILAVALWHQTLKRFLDRQAPARSLAELQGQLDRFVDYYNEVRPHRSLGRKTPRSAFEARTKARPSRPGIFVEGYRVRHDKVDKAGKVTLRYRGKLQHIGIGQPYKGRHIVLLVAGRHVRVLDDQNHLIRESSHSIRPRPISPKNDLVVYDVLTHVSPMSRDITACRRGVYLT